MVEADAVIRMRHQALRSWEDHRASHHENDPHHRDTQSREQIAERRIYRLRFGPNRFANEGIKHNAEQHGPLQHSQHLDRVRHSDEVSCRWGRGTKYCTSEPKQANNVFLAWLAQCEWWDSVRPGRMRTK